MSTTPTAVVVSGRLSFFNGFDPTAFQEGDPLKYNTSVMWPKSDTALTAKITAAYNAAVEEGKVKIWGGKKYGTIKDVMHDGDEKRPDDVNYQGMYYITPKSNIDKPPRIVKKVDGVIENVTDRSEVYSGCYAHVSVNFYPHKQKGVAVGFQSLLKWKNGERLAGGKENVANTYGDGFETVEGDNDAEFDV